MKTPHSPHTAHEMGSHALDTNDIQLIVHRSWMLAGIAIALAACTVADEANLHEATPESNAAAVHAKPAANAASGNVQDMSF